MGRSRDKGVLNDLFEVAAAFHWSMGVALAAISYFVLHYFALSVAVPSAGVSPGSGVIVRSFLHAIASVIQYIVPCVCLAGSVASVVGRRKREGLVNAAASGGRAAVSAMSWKEFEFLVGESFRLAGFEVVETGGGGADGGVDLILRKGGERFLVQCKQWRALKVSVGVVRELYGVMADQGAAGAFVVTSGRFTEDACAFANGRNIELIDGDALAEVLARVGRIKEPLLAQNPNTPPACPLCRSSMVRRTAKRGANAGKDFWGCSAYPGCKGTREVG